MLNFFFYENVNISDYSNVYLTNVLPWVMYWENFKYVHH